MENERICTKCKECKLFKEFSKNKKGKFGISEICKSCKSKIAKEYNIKNKDKIKIKYEQVSKERKENGYYKKYREANTEKLANNHKKYYTNNKEKMNKQSKENYELNKKERSLQGKKYRENNKEIIKARKRKYYEENKDKIRAARRIYEKERYPIKCKLIKTLRSRIRTALRLYKKSESSKVLLGCDLEFYKNYLESKFTNGMTWVNFNLNGWHIDHIIPCSSFDLSDPEKQKECFNYKNTVPRWATTKIAISYGENSDYIGNLEKGNKIIQ